MCPQEAGEGMAQPQPEIQVNTGASEAGSVASKKVLGAREAVHCCIWGYHLGQCQSEDPRANAVCSFHRRMLRNTITTRILGVYYPLAPAPTPNINYLIEPSQIHMK